MNDPSFIPPHGGYEELKSFRKTRIVYDATVRFCERFHDHRDRTVDQMVQAARSGKQNILEGSQASGTKCNRFGELFNSEFIHYYHPNTIMR